MGKVFATKAGCKIAKNRRERAESRRHREKAPPTVHLRSSFILSPPVLPPCLPVCVWGLRQSETGFPSVRMHDCAAAVFSIFPHFPFQQHHYYHQAISLFTLSAHCIHTHTVHTEHTHTHTLVNAIEHPNDGDNDAAAAVAAAPSALFRVCILCVRVCVCRLKSNEVGVHPSSGVDKSGRCFSRVSFSVTVCQCVCVFSGSVGLCVCVLVVDTHVDYLGGRSIEEERVVII